MDAKRGVRCEVMALGGLESEGVPFPLKVARVNETRLKPKPTESAEEVFWVITSDASLTGEELRELAHLRWRIENNIFKRLSALVASKHRYTHKPEVREALLLMWFAALALLGACLIWWWQHGPREEDLQTMKFTWGAAFRML